jgi:predicted ATPase/DNA-binding SARP family transcriptional activator
VEYRILGPLEVRDGGRSISLGTAKQQALLAVLVLHANEFVARERLIDELWGESPPPTAAKAVQVYVSHLRKLLAHNGEQAITTGAGGYVLPLDGEGVDALSFECLARDAREHAAGGDAAGAAALFRQALNLWRGPALAGLSFESAARNEVDRLEEERLAVLMDRIDCDLGLGRHGQLVGELEGLVAQHPLRERLRSQLMLALYRSGRQADALRVYREGRETLVEELGLEPSEPLQRLERAILVHDPALEAPAGLTRTKEPETPGGRDEQSNLPVQPTSFLGRERELADVLSLLARDEVRLLTLTGAGGSGKTRLALEAAGMAADDFQNGVCWIPLAALRDPGLVRDSIGQALGTQQELAQHLADKHMLLLLDNFEHLPAAAPRVAELAAACPKLKLLVTSRERLHLAGEREYLVPTLAEHEAVELFRQRAQAAEPEQAVLAICRRLDCLPLAVELAAARAKLLPPEALLQRLDKRLPLLTGGPRDAPERQRTLEAAIAWSYDLLNESERRLFARLAVFAGGCTLAAAEQVCDADLDTLQSLVDKNLVRREGERYQMLETIREYAAERLEEARDREDVRRRHAEHFLALAEQAEPHLTGSRPREWGNRLEDELDNFRAALGRLQASGEEEPVLRGKALLGASRMALRSGDNATARLRSEEALVLHRTLGDDWGSACSQQLLGHAVTAQGDYASALQLLEQSVRTFRVLGDEGEALQSNRFLAMTCYMLGEHERARALHEDNLRRARATGDKPIEGAALASLALHAREEGRAQDVGPLLSEAYRIHRDLGSWWIAIDLAHFARAVAVAGEAGTAARLLSKAEALLEGMGMRYSLLTKMNEKTLATIRPQLTEAALTEAWEQGQGLAADDAMAIALECLD